MTEIWKDILEGLTLGLVQGMTEFLPVSSSGHLVLLEKLGSGEPSLAFNLLLHIATLAAVCIAMRKDVWAWLRHPLSKDARLLYAALVPTGIIAALFLFLGRELVDGELLPFGFFATSILLIFSMFLNPKKEKSKLLTACVTGAAQGIAALPGLSRSGATITVMTMLGVPREKAVRTSFLLSLPVILGGTAVSLIGGEFTFGAYSAATVATGAVAAFGSGLLSLRFMLKIFSKGGNIPFAVYTAALGVLSLFV